MSSSVLGWYLHTNPRHFSGKFFIDWFSDICPIHFRFFVCFIVHVLFLSSECTPVVYCYSLVSYARIGIASYTVCAYRYRAYETHIVNLYSTDYQ